MSENKLKSSLLEKYSLKSSLLTSNSLGSSSLLKSSLTSTSMTSTFKLNEPEKKSINSESSLLVYGKKKSPVEEITHTTTSIHTNTDTAAKKSKLLTNESNLVNYGLLFKPSILSTKSNTNYSSPSISSNTHSPSSSLLTRSDLSSKSLLSSKIVNLSTKIEQVQIEMVQQPTTAKRPYFHLDSSESHNSLFLQQEYLKTDALIEAINLEQKKYEDEMVRVKKLKKSNNKASTSFLDNCIFLKNELTILQRQKNILINTVSGSLLRQPNFKNANDPTRLALLRCAETIIKGAGGDPEFILKVALYTRQELNIRVTANFLLCLASYFDVCRPFLQKYFKASIQLPSDWIEVAEQYQLFMDKKINFGALPSALRKVMCEKFSDFDQYQLAKYNKEKSRSAKNNNLKDVKHVKSRLKDANGNEDTTDAAVVEDKYIKTLNVSGLKINDRIYVECVIPEKCTSFKIDIIQQDDTKSQASADFRPSKTRRGVPLKPPKEEKPNESVAVRIVLDYINRRITQRSFLNKTWSKRSDNINSPASFDFVKTFEILKFFVNVSANEFVFGHINNEGKEFILSKYPHSRHNIELLKLNTIRISGVGIKLKNLKIKSTDLIQFDTQESEENDENVLKQRSFTLKQLIRQLHISSPVENVLALIGKKYPSTYEEFMLTKLPGIFDSEKCGKRMKLPTPETWETQISMHGNKAEVWEKLIDNKKLPYMAMLRNLRNMIKVGISERHHQWIIKKLQDEGAVVHSRQFPFRFFTAYEVLDELEEEYNKYILWATTTATQPEPQVPAKAYRGKKTKRNKNEPKQITDMNYDPDILKRYKTALDNALKVATTFNVSPIKGSTAIFLNMSRAMNFFVGGSAKSLGKKATSLSDIAALLALMFKYSCEHSKLIVFSDYEVYTDIELEQGTILDNMKSLTELKNLRAADTNKNHSALYPYRSFTDMLSLKENYDNIIYLSNGVGDIEFHKSFLRKYRSFVNENLLFVNVNLSVAECGLASDFNFDHENDVSISGYSDAILRFVAERGNQGQLIHVENIDKSYDLPILKHLNAHTIKTSTTTRPVENLERPKFKIYVPKLEWKTIKVFISSTFLDMHSERDILTRTVFPMLRAKLSPYLINVNEIDLRWGITETEANNNEALDICLTQVLDSDYFLSMLGERYGHILNDYTCTGKTLKWLSTYPLGASITELEIECQLNKTSDTASNKYEKAFFYFRDPTFLQQVPDEIQSHFMDENDESRRKLAKLKTKLLSQPIEIFNGYKCKWLKLEENSNRALVTDLDTFAHRVFNNLFNAIYNHNKDAVQLQQQQTIELNESIHQSNLNDAYAQVYADAFVGRAKLLNKFHKLLSENQFVETLSTTTDASRELIDKKNATINILHVNGENGCGKTSLLAHFIKNSNNSILKHKFVHYVGSYENSEYVLMFLKRFCVKVSLDYGLFADNHEQNEMNESNDFNFFKETFGKILKKLSDLIQKEKFYIVLDGVDSLLDTNKTADFSFSWLPSFIPPRISFIFTARSTSLQVKSALSKLSNSRIKLDIFDVEPLDQLDKSEFVRLHLSKFNKRLDETTLFNNQMKLLTTKRDSVSPLYLAWACDELRQFNHYETLSQKIKELPIKISLLVEYTLKRLETTFGSTFTQAAFMFIACAASTDGLMEHELKKLIELYFNIENLNCTDFIEKCTSFEDLKRDGLDKKIFSNSPCSDASTLKVCSFIQSISQTFLKPRSNDVLCLATANSCVENCLRIRYGAKSARPNAMFAHKLMALYYWHLLDENLANNWNITAANSQRAFISLPYHLSLSTNLNDLGLILCDLKFLAAKCKLGLIYELMDDFDMHQSITVKSIFTTVTTIPTGTKFKSPASLLTSQTFLDYKLFFSTNAHLLKNNPELIYQQAMNQPEASSVASDLINLLESSSNKTGGGLLFEWINKAKDSDKFKLFPVKIQDTNEAAISSVSISPDGQKVACGTENCEIRLFAMASANLLKVLQGHSGRINSTCFVDNDTLCSASSDGIASIWNTTDGYRVKVLNKHNGHAVSSCSGEPNGKSLITVGWDCTAKLWSKSGELQGELKGHPRPINCVVFKPEGDLVATCCWDSCIRIYNVVDRTRKAILRGHSASVRFISYSANGVYIASSSIDSEVKLWNSMNGAQIATLKSHSMPVNTVRFSPNSQFLVTASTDLTTKVWAGNVGKMVNVIRNENDSESQDAKITSVCFDQRNGEYIAVGYHSGELKMYDLLGSGSLIAKVKAHNAQIKRIKFSHFGNFLVTASEDGSVKVMEISTGLSKIKEVCTLKDSTKSINALAINKHNTLITGSEDCLILVYTRVFENIQSSKKSDENLNIFDDDYDDSEVPMETNALENTVITNKPKFALDTHKSPVTACSFNTNGDKFASASKNGQIIIWSINQLVSNVTELISIPNAHSDWITDIQFSNTSDFILTSSNDFTLKIWNSIDGKQRQHLTGHTSNIKSCAFQYGCAVSCAYDGSVKVWSHKGHEITTLTGHQKAVNACDVYVKLKSKNKLNKEAINNGDDDGEKMEMGDLWSDRVEEESWVNKHKTAALNKQDYEVDKFYLVTVSDDNSIRLWKPIESEYLISLESHTGKINSIDLDKNNMLVTGSSDKSINLWNMNDYFKNYTSGLHVNQAERLIRNHNSEIVCICSTRSGSYVLTSSRDGILIVWKCIYDARSKLKEIKFILEIQAHDRPCNRICILEENPKSTTFATCSDRAPVKIWKFEEGSSLENSSITLIQSLKTTTNDYVLHIDLVRKLNQNFLIIVESSLFRISIKFYKCVNKAWVVQSAQGCSIINSGYSIMINQVKITNDTLLITLPVDDIIKIDLNDIVKRFQTYTYNSLLLKSTSDNAVKDLSLEGSKKNWFVSVDEIDLVTLAGDVNGNLYTNEKTPSILAKSKTIHKSRITELICLNSERLVSSSHDGTIKIWSKYADTQLGQYNSNSGISVLSIIPRKDKKDNFDQVNFIFGDMMGNLNLLRWYDE
jgi:telomerase protein component 1